MLIGVHMWVFIKTESLNAGATYFKLMSKWAYFEDTAVFFLLLAREIS